MNVLRQLWQDAQSVLRDMSTTHRVAVTFLVLTVAAWLAFAAWLGGTPEETGRRPLPMQIEPGDSNDILGQLRGKGVRSAVYDYDERRILVNVDEEKLAVIALAEEGLLQDAHAFGFMEMLDKWSFSDTTARSEEAMRYARANEVARLIENLDQVKEAQVIYSDDARRSLFGVAHKKTASVRVRTKLRKPLSEDQAETIIALVAAAKAGLDARDVVVTDQMGNKFHTSSSNGISAMAKQKWDTEFALDEKLRRTLENLMRQYVPNIQYEGDVNAFPKHEVSFDYREQVHKEILPGEVGSSNSRTYSQTTTRRPPEEPGVQPNARRVANLAGAGGWYYDESRTNEKEKSQINENSVRETATKFSPSVRNLTVSAIIHLPYTVRRDETGRPIPTTNEAGEQLRDPETRLPMWERESIPPLSMEKIEELKRQIAHAAGIALADIPEKIEVSQVAWMPPIHPPEPAPSETRELLARAWESRAFIGTALAFAVAGIFLLRYMSKPVPTDTDEYVPPESISLALSSADDEEDLSDVEWENLRSRVAAAVQEDPKRAANLVKRWIRKD